MHDERETIPPAPRDEAVGATPSAPAGELGVAPVIVVPAGPPAPRRVNIADDYFRRFFVRGLSALLPTVITLWLLVWVWNFLWENIGRHIIWVIKWLWQTFRGWWIIPDEPSNAQIRYYWDNAWFAQPLGVGLAILLVYLVGVLVGNFLGRTMWRLAERAVMRLPLVRAIYPSVKQVTDFVLADRKGGQFQSSQVVAVQARAQGVWAIGLVTGAGYGPLNDAIRGDMLTIFIPSSPTAVAGYVVVAHREAVVELPLTVEEAMRLLVSGGVITPTGSRATTAAPAAGKPGPADARAIRVQSAAANAAGAFPLELAGSPHAAPLAAPVATPVEDDPPR